MIINSSLCIAFVCFTICTGWLIGAKGIYTRNFDFIPLYETLFFKLLPPVMLLVILIALIINWVNYGFLSSLCYLGIISGTGVINGLIITPILVKIFGYDGFGAIIPIIACIAAAVFLFVSL